MRISIVGAGAMGSLFGALLAPVASVILVDLWQEHVDAINAHGLELTGLSGDRNVKVKATTDPAVAGQADLVIVFVKSHQTPWAAEIAARILSPGGIALTLQNGLGNAEVVEAAVGRPRTCAGVTGNGATLLGPGRVRHAGKGPTHLGANDETEGRVRAVAELFGSAGIEAVVSFDLAGLIWGKLMANVGLNAITALARVQTGMVNHIAPLGELADAAVREAAAVVKAKGIDLPYLDPIAYVRGVANATATNRTSMLQDVLRGVPTEVEVMNGAIVREGERLGIPTPVNATLLALIRGIERAYKERV